MKILTTDTIKNGLLKELRSNNIKSTLHILSKDLTDEGSAYKNFIVKRCKEFDINYKEKNFESFTNNEDIVTYTDNFNKNDSFIILLPFGCDKNLDYLRENIKLKDIDGFTYESMGKTMEAKEESLPATPRAIINFLESLDIDIKGKNIVIANSTNLIGMPLANYFTKKRAFTSLLNSSYPNPKKIIRGADIFISAIGKANYFTKEYFTDGQLLIDVGTSLVNGKIVGDINYKDLENLDLEVLTSKRGIGAITTLTLLKSLID